MTRDSGDHPILLNISFQYRSRGKVTVACAGTPVSSNILAALAAVCLSANNPYTVEPEPDNETYFAPERSRARLTSRTAGYLGKTTLSKSFSIPVRTRSRSDVSGRSQPLLGTPVGVKL